MKSAITASMSSGNASPGDLRGASVLSISTVLSLSTSGVVATGRMKRVIGLLKILLVAPFSSGIVVEDSDTLPLRFSHRNFVEGLRTGEVIGMTCVDRTSRSLSVQS